MATIATYPEWYDRSNNIVPRMDITEVNILNNYTPTGNEIVSWDASYALDNSIRAYIVATKLILVCDSLTEIPDKMFFKFISLEKISGLQNVTTIGAWAFLFTPVLTSVDIIPTNLTSIGNDAFRMSSIEDTLDLSNVSLNIIGDRATRRKRWSESGLSIVQSVEFPSNKIYLNVPNADSQLKYTNVAYVTVDGSIKTVAEAACRTLSCYHAWNIIYAGTNKEYPDFITWFNDKLNVDGTYAENTDLSETSRLRDYATLGWEQTGVEYAASASQLEYILNELSSGFPVYITMRGTSELGYHSALCVGCDINTKKLAIVDSAIRDDTGVIYWIAYEDLFTEGDTESPNEVIRKLDYNLPILAAGDSWFTQGGTNITRSSITEIHIVDSYTQSGNEIAFWDASDKKNGRGMVYINGTKLIIAGNGSGTIYTNPNSSWVFSDSAKQDYFSNVTQIIGGSLLNTRNATTMEYMFNRSLSFTTIDASNWNTSNVTSMKCMFQNCKSLTVLDVSNWDTSNVNTMLAMFNMTNNNTGSFVNYNLTSLDVSGWNVSRVTDMRNLFGNLAAVNSLDVSKWNTSSVTTMENLFVGCESIKKLDFTNWDTSNVATTLNMFNGTYLEKIVMGEKCNFLHDHHLPAPSSDHIPFADGKWYDYDYNAYSSEDIPGNVARTYYASKFIAAGADDRMVFVKNGTLRQIAFALRVKNNKTDAMYPSTFAEEVLALDVESAIELANLLTSVLNRTVTEVVDNTTTSLGERAFSHCKELISAELTQVKTAYSFAFGNCTKLIRVKLPSATYAGWGAFENSTALQFVDFSANVRIDGNCFNNCFALKAAIFRNPSICTLAYPEACFLNSGITAGTGYIYVPSALLDSYKVAANWSTYATQFRALEDYTVDGTTTGELDESKI